MNRKVALASRSNTLTSVLTLDDIRKRTPAVFAPTAHQRMSAKYNFIPTERVLTGLLRVGFVPVEARQTRARRASALYTRHVLRLRRRVETVRVKDSVPEVLFLNSHDGTSAYQLRIGLFRVVCTNGLIVSRGAFPTYRVPHRGNAVDDVIAAAIQVSEQFGSLAEQVDLMERRRLSNDEQIRFAERALALRFQNPATTGITPAQLLACRRPEDAGDDLWSALNKVQEALLGGGLILRSAGAGWPRRTRRITSIREDLRLNSGLWDLAVGLLAA